MFSYSVCSVIIISEIEIPGGYDSFFIKKVNLENNSIHDFGEADITILREDKTHVAQNLIMVSKLQYMYIFGNISHKNSFRWVYEATNGVCSLAISADYSLAKYDYADILGSVSREELGKIAGPFFQVLLECKLVQKEFSILHASCIDINGSAYAFVGPSGIGKSSRARKWIELFSAEWISGDRPAIDVTSGTVYGVPWDGKEAIYRNVNRPLDAILKVTRSEKTFIKIMSDEEKFQLLCEQSFIPMWDPILAAKAMHSLKKLIRMVPIFELGCDITDASTYKAKELITDALKGQ